MRLTHAGLGASAAALLACSTALEDEKSRDCKVDSDCVDAGKVCNAGLCTEDRLPARDPIALDVRSEAFGDPPFRVEILGKDAAVARYLDDRPYRYRVTLGNTKTTVGVRDTLFISLEETRKTLQEGESPVAPLAGTFTLSQGSRLGRSTLKSPPITYPPSDMTQEEMPTETPSVEQPWPRYAPTDVSGDLPLILEISPADDVEPAAPGNQKYGRGIVYRQFLRKNTGSAAQHNLAVTSVRECHRKVDGLLRFPDGVPQLPPIPPMEGDPNITVSLRYAGRVPDDDPNTLTCDPNPGDGGTPLLCSIDTIVPQPADQCDSPNQCAPPYGCHVTPAGDEKRCGCKADAECPAGQYCNPEHQLCALDLTDRPASKPLDLPVEESTFFPWVYTYCDDDYTAQHQMEVVVVVDPDSRLGLPRLTFRDVLDFYYNNDEPEPTPLDPICLPTWDPVQPVELRLTQQPATVYTDPRDRTWTCCDTGCISPADDKVAAVPTSCTLRAALSATTSFAIDPNKAPNWVDCLPPESSTGSLSLDDCSADDTPCMVQLSPGPPGGAGQEYRLRIEPPVGSIFRSDFATVQVSAGVPAIDVALPYRVLVRGKVTLADCTVPPEGGTCTPEAEIVAERIIRKEIEAGEDLLGPFLFTTSTLPDTPGEYVLPLNPGLYLLTALPKITVGASQAAPAPIGILDVRPGSKLVKEKNGVPYAEAPDLVLAQSGLTFTLEFDDFDLSTRVIPLDQTSWTNGNKGIGYEFEDYRLSEPGVCDRTSGCQIRRLRPGNSPVYLTRERFINYVMRPAPE